MMLGRRTKFDIENHHRDAASAAPELRPKSEMMPLAAAAAAAARQKTSSSPSLPVPIPKVPSPPSDKKYKTTATIVRKESNGNSN